MSGSGGLDPHPTRAAGKGPPQASEARPWGRPGAASDPPRRVAGPPRLRPTHRSESSRQLGTSTFVGTDDEVNVPLPSCPLVLTPQQ